MDNIVIDIAADPNLTKWFFDKMDEPIYAISSDYISTLKGIKGIRSISGARMVSRVSSPEDYQTQLKLLSQIQAFQDQIHEMLVNLRVLRENWNDLLNHAQDYVTKTYYDKLAEMKNETTKKSVVAAALRPIQAGLDKVEMLLDLAKDSMKHLDRTAWNIKEANALIVEYLAPLKYPTKGSV